MRNLTLILILISQGSFGQNNLQGVVTANYSRMSTDVIGTNQIYFGLGLRWQRKLELSIGLQEIQNRRKSELINNFGVPIFKAKIISCTPSYRFLDSNRLISPKIAIDIGTSIWSNARSYLNSSKLD